MIPEFKFCLEKGASEDFLPTQGEPTATGYDVKVFLPYGDLEIAPFGTALIPLGLRCFAPEGWWLSLESRSSSFIKKDLLALDGIIDEGYEGDIRFACRYIPKAGDDSNLILRHGDRLGQLVPVRRQSMNVQQVTPEEFAELCKARGGKRGAGGFGSTGG